MSVEVKDTIDITLVEKIAAKLRNYLPASFEVIASESYNTVGIIYATGQDWQVCGFTFKKAVRYYFGTIFTEVLGLSSMYKHTIGASSTHWIFTVSGRENIETAKGLAEILSDAFPGISVKVILYSEKPEKQRNLIDCGI